MEIHIAVEGHHDLSGQIYRQLRAGILEGRLAGGTRLPSTRELGTQLGVSRKTTLGVFERLLSEGYLSARGGSGTFVADGLERLPVERSAHARAAESSRERAKAKAAARAQPLWDPGVACAGARSRHLSRHAWRAGAAPRDLALPGLQPRRRKQLGRRDRH